VVDQRNRKLWTIIALWLGLTFGALYAMADYGTQPGRSEQAPAQWPDGLQTMIEPDPARRGMVDLHVLFFEPADPAAMSAVWEASDLKRMAARLPGTHLHADVEGRIARHFGAYTSGQVLLYDTQGALQFAGGITPSRGHTGTNPGRAAIISSIMSDEGVDPLAPRTTPVFGCSLHDEEEGDLKLGGEPLAMSAIESQE